MRLIFMGTPQFALPSLRRLAQEGHQLLAVVTQPDRPAGRGQKLTPPPVKVAARELGLPVLQPQRARDEAFIAQLKGFSPDLIVVVAYGQLLPVSLLELPPKGCINLHASLLPKFRGAAPINWAILSGEEETGVSIILINERMDAGPILLQQAEPILAEDTAGSLEARLAERGAEALLLAIRALERGEVKLVPQEESLASYAPKLKKEDGLIRWDWEARRLDYLIRGLSPEPAAFTFWRGRRVEVLRSRLADTEGEREAPGAVLQVDGEGVLVQAGKGTLWLLTLKPEGRRAMTAAEFARGARLKRGEAFGGGKGGG